VKLIDDCNKSSEQESLLRDLRAAYGVYFEIDKSLDEGIKVIVGG